MKFVRILGIVLAAIVVLAIVAGVYLFGHEAVPESSDYVIDRNQLKYVAYSIPGPLPVRVNHLRIAETEMPRAALFAGFDFAPHRMVHGAYQVVYSDGSYVLIDAGFSRDAFKDMGRGEDENYDDEAFAKLTGALPGARLIVLTHEHRDHIQGLAEVENPAALAEQIVMPTPQLSNPATTQLLPTELLDAIVPIRYTGIRPIAPGIVIQPAAGHTPGSQLIYVRTQDDREFLFIGDVAWHMDAIRNLAYRPRLVTDLLLGEDRAAVMAQFRTLHGLLDDARLNIVSSHDLDQLEALQTAGLLGSGLERPAQSAD